jgi:hypothetical protein
MSTLKKYNQAVMAIPCPTCGVGPRERCMPTSGMPMGSRPTPPHSARVKEATKSVG